MSEIFFLIFLAIVWLSFALVQDLKRREIANWLNFSLIVFALGFRLFFSIFSDNFRFFWQGIFGLAIFFILGNLLYYSRFFAGGDAKLLISLGTILPISMNFKENIQIFIIFFIIFFITGAFYSIVASLYLSLKNLKKFKKELNKQFKKNRNIIISLSFLSLIFLILGFFIESLFFYLGLLFFVFPYLYFYIKSFDESCMIRKTRTKDLTEGDWLYKDIKIGKKLIKAKWEGLTKKEISKLKKSYKYVLIKYGVPFSPVFLITIIIVFYLKFNRLWYPFW